MNEEQRIRREAILQEIRDNGGEKAFAIGQASGECFRFLAGLEVDGLIELVPSKDPLVFIYRLLENQ